MQPHSLLTQQKRAADRSAHCHWLSRLRIAQGYLGAALFYQHEAARHHVKACELRDQMQADKLAKAAAYWRMKERLATNTLTIADHADVCKVIGILYIDRSGKLAMPDIKAA